MVRRREVERGAQLPGPTSGEKRKKSRAVLGSGGWQETEIYVCAAAQARVQICERAAGARREGWRLRRSLHAYDSGAADCAAGVRADWRDSFGRVRRIQRGVAGGPHWRRESEMAHYSGWWVSARARGSVERYGGQGD